MIIKYIICHSGKVVYKLLPFDNTTFANPVKIQYLTIRKYWWIEFQYAFLLYFSSLLLIIEYNICNSGKIIYELLPFDKTTIVILVKSYI